jgi:large subunit ribosomal protein L25
MAKTVIEAEPRELVGKSNARKLRRTGRIPAVIYGAGRPSRAITLDPKQMRGVLESLAGRNTVLDVSVDGETSSAIISDWQYEPLKGTLLHIDLKRIALDKMLEVTIPVHSVGESKGVKVQGGLLEFVHRDVDVECLPGDIPEHIEVDVTELALNASIRARDLKLPGGVKLLTDPDQVLIHVILPKATEAKLAEAEAAEAAVPEPEVIRKGRGEKEGEE